MFVPSPIQQNRHAIYIRLSTHTDAQKLMEMHERVSQASLWSRYFRPHKPTMAELMELCLRCNGASFVAVAGRPFSPVGAGWHPGADSPTSQGLGQVVGLGSYTVHHQDPSVAEIAFLVEDRYQGQGIGQRLFLRLAKYARRHHVSTLEAYVLSSNESMMHVFRSGGFAVRERINHGLREVEIDLAGATRAPAISPLHSTVPVCAVGPC